MAIARVEPLITARALRGPYDYRLPEGMLEAAGVGAVLRIPFGRQRPLGVVVGRAESSDLPPEKLAKPFAVVHPAAVDGARSVPGPPPDLIALALRMAREYCSTPARALALVTPPGTGSAAAPRAQIERLVTITAAGRAALGGGRRLGARQEAVLTALAGPGELSATDLRETAGADAGALRRLAELGLVSVEEVASMRRPASRPVGSSGPAPELTSEQAAALAAVEAGAGEEILLHGVTGSGKTEVYLAAAERALAARRGVIVLVPEIGLTPQALTRFRERLGDTVAVLHSRLGAGERLDEWRRLRSGEARVCVGPRSAVLAPVEALGLIVVDEEHDSSYKHEGDPRYDARELAGWRAEQSGATVVLGTATPRPETWHRHQNGAVATLERRVDGRPLPEVEVLDMRARHGGAGPLHPRTLEELHAVRSAGAKAIVMVSRRGYSPFVDCRECGHAFACEACDVSLVLHRNPERLRCHHCGFDAPAPRRCPTCGSVSIGRHGSGSERVAELLEAELGGLALHRLDADTAAGSGAHARVLSAFERAPSGVLVGTQMVGKGHDFPDVTLAVVLDADSTLRFPDFRAEERTFSLVAQLAGRSGRGAAGGRVLVQTLAPDAPSIAAAARHDAPAFLAGELERRRVLRYPPFAELIRIELGGEEERPVREAADRIASALEGRLGEGTDLLGPAPLFRLRNRHRRHLLLKCSERGRVVDAIGAQVAEIAPRLRGVAVSVDVGPQ